MANVDLNDGNHDLDTANTNLTGAVMGMPGTPTAAEEDALIDWARSQRIGDPLHTQPDVIEYGSGIGDGNRHNHDDLPIVLIGEAAGRIVTGQHTRFKKETPLTNLYLTMIQQAGGRDRQFGDSTDTIDGLFT